MKKNSVSVTFRIAREVDEKLQRYMKAINETNKSRCILRALETGIDTLEAIGWDKSKELARRMASKQSATPQSATQPVSPNNLQILPDASSHSTPAAGVQQAKK